MDLQEQAIYRASRLTGGERVFLEQCAGCHGPSRERRQGAVLAQLRLSGMQTDDESLFLVTGDQISD